MLMNNLDPEVAERPEDLVVYGGSGKAARSWDDFHRIVRELEELEGDETLLVQSGRAVGRFRTHTGRTAGPASPTACWFPRGRTGMNFGASKPRD